MRLIWYADFTEKIPLEFGTQMSLCFLGLIGIGRERMAGQNVAQTTHLLSFPFKGQCK